MILSFRHKGSSPVLNMILLAGTLASCAGGQPRVTSDQPVAAPGASISNRANASSSATAGVVDSMRDTNRQQTDALSDEGMWTLNRFPSERVAKKYGFSPSKQWLDHVRLASVRLANGCSGSVVSANGLVMTNHHCAHTCIEHLSNAKKDYVAKGFYASTSKDEVRCPGMEIDQLVDITDVTDRVGAATRGLADREYNEAQKSELSTIEKTCATAENIRCDVVSLYHGGQYQLYKYRRFQDVRLVFAPEFAIAFFGGDPDNFMFPRYDLDVSFLRLYEGGAPVSSEHYFTWSSAGAHEGELTFVAGHPGSTSRMLTAAELAFLRDVALPNRLLRLAEARGVLAEFQRRGPEQKRISSATLFHIENSIKALKGKHEALLDRQFFSTKLASEQALREKVNADPTAKQKYAGAWDAIAAAEQTYRGLYKPYTMIEQGAGFWSELVGFAWSLVRAADELPKPNEKRLREYAESTLPAFKQKLFSPAPIYDELEALTLSLSLTQLREALGPDDPAVKNILGKDAPYDLALALIKGTKLKDVNVRKALFEGGKAAIDASQDPLITWVRRVEPQARAIRKKYEDTVEAVVKKNSERIAQAQFATYGTSVYPDATSTLRLSYGSVQGWVEQGRPVAPITTLGGAFERHTGKDPFALPASWLSAKARLELSTPLNFCSTNDIIGGNSGSPVVNQQAEIVGLIFDGNIHSLGGDYAYDESANRAVAVHSAALLEALDKVYKATRLRDELRPAGPGSL